MTELEQQKFDILNSEVTRLTAAHLAEVMDHSKTMEQLIETKQELLDFQSRCTGSHE